MGCCVFRAGQPGGQADATAGRASNPSDRSAQVATPRSGRRSSTVPTSWTANGSPVASRPVGSEIAGTPSVLHGAHSEPSPVPSTRVGATEFGHRRDERVHLAREPGPCLAGRGADPFRVDDLLRCPRLPGEDEVADGRPVLRPAGGEPRGMGRGRAGLEQDATRVGQAVEGRRQREVDDLRPVIRQPRDDLVEVASQLGSRPVEGGADHAQARRDGRPDLERLARQHALEQRDVGHRPGDRPAMVERPRQRHHPLERDRAERPLAADDAAVGGGPQDRADRLRADGAGDHPRRDGRRRPGRRPARRVPERPRVARGGRVAVGELGGVGLAEDDRPGGAEPGHERRVARRERVREGRRAGPGGHAGDIDDVLDPDRHAMERSGRVPGRAGGIALARLGEGGSRIKVDPRPDRGIQRVDPLETCGGQRHRRPLAVADPARRLDDAGVGQRRGGRTDRRGHAAPPSGAGRRGVRRIGDDGTGTSPPDGEPTQVSRA